ncbi:hypothetical protein A5699_10080 [Mycobacterium sp. E802]|uniref:hypothetical protein n=1 Tax=Mycobacterium sp. E802 TaxID=1834152 RepID=UPI0007FDC261|nr:hypothetical protein [Mycobacterium sp. E802]OBG80816.1 hypothetical protein A5699_10080 [Mycobacterium sp. E802]
MPIYVLLRMYSGEGAFLSHTEITADRVAHHYMHLAIAKGESTADCEGLVKLYPNQRGQIAVTTQSGSISCLIEPGRTACETPAGNWPRHEDGTPYHSFRFHASGEIEWVDGQMGDLARATLDAGGKYRAFEWRIIAVDDGIALTNDQTGRGVRVTPEGVEGF